MIREIDLGEDGVALAGIHFVAMDVAHPFAGITARTTPIRTRQAARRIGRKLREALAPFAPRGWWVWEGPLDTGLRDMPGIETDQHLVAAPLGALRSLPELTIPCGSEVSLHQTSAAPIYDAYARIHERFIAEHPQMSHVLQLETIESLEDIADRGLLCRVEIAGSFAGLFGTRPDREPPIDGWVMVEEILDTPWRGRGLAAPLQRQLVDRIPADDDTLLFGHIGGTNTPSLRTALRVGREIVGRWVFVPFE